MCLGISSRVTSVYPEAITKLIWSSNTKSSLNHLVWYSLPSVGEEKLSSNLQGLLAGFILKLTWDKLAGEKHIRSLIIHMPLVCLRDTQEHWLAGQMAEAGTGNTISSLRQKKLGWRVSCGRLPGKGQQTTVRVLCRGKSLPSPLIVKAGLV